MSQVSSTVTFLCTHCSAKFRAPSSLRGARVLCRSCKAVTSVSLEAPSKILREKNLIDKLEGSIQEWVRTKCSCGKPIKAPAALAGQEGACPRCMKTVRLPELSDNTDIPVLGDELSGVQPVPQPGSPDIGVLDASHDTLSNFSLSSQPSPDSRQIKYNPLKQIKSDPTARFDGFVRATCVCGYRVKAPAELGGKTGTCPRCSQPVAMPLPPVFKLVSAIDAMVNSEDVEHIDDSAESEKSAVIALGSLAESLDTSLEVAPPQEDPTTPQQTQPQLQSLAGETAIQKRLFFAKLFFRLRYEKFHARIVQNPVTTLAISFFCLIAAVYLTYWEYQHLWRSQQVIIPWKSQAAFVPFYDIKTGSLITGSSDVPSPIPGPHAKDDPALAADPANQAFRAYLFSCTDCSTAESKFVGLIEKFDPGVAEAWQRRMEGNRIPHITPLYDANLRELTGRFIASPKELNWVPAQTTQGIELRKSIEITACPSGKIAELCRE